MSPSTLPELDAPPPGQVMVACAECDQLMYCPVSSSQGIPRCPVCGAQQQASRPFNPVTPLAIALTALILAIPANIYPQLTFSLLGQPNYYTLVGGAQHLLESGFWWVGLLVLIGTVAAPLGLLALIFLICVAWFSHAPTGFLAPLLKGYHHLTSWVMLDVYLLSVIVSVVKLKDLGQFEFSMGFYCFVLLLLTLSAAMTTFNQERFWDLLEERNRARD